jgi:4'-phosphopantetheinyl transferase
MPASTNSLRAHSREVHVWRARLSASATELRELVGLLSSEERNRADRFRNERDCARFALGRIVARSVLGQCLQRPPKDVQLTLDRSDKPVVATSADMELHFNIAHSEDYVLLAVASGRRIGVDVEWVREAEDLNEIAARYFSRNEYLTLQAIPEPLRTKSFFACWTLKEAYLKARGDGIRLPLDVFDVAFAPDEMPRLLETRFDSADADRWHFRELDLGPAYVAALAIEAGVEPELKLWDWNSSSASAAHDREHQRNRVGRRPNVVIGSGDPVPDRSWPTRKV